MGMVCGGGEERKPGSNGDVSSIVHNTPVVGHFTAFFADSLGGAFGIGKLTEEEMRVEFEKIDKDKSGTLDKTEISDALRGMNKSEIQIQKIIDGMEEDELSFDEFKAIMQGKPQPYLTSVGGIPLPNLAKVHDIPILGAFTGAAQNLVTGITWSLMGVAFGAAFGKLTDAQLRAKFEEIDEDKSGTLDAKEIAKALRGLKMNEKDIKQMTDAVGEKELNFVEFKQLVKPGEDSGSVHDVPVVGHFTRFFADSFGGALGFKNMTEEEMRAAFANMDKDNSGTLDKTEIRSALLETGKPEQEIQQLIDGMEQDELTFDEFKSLIEGKARPYVTSVGVAGVNVPLPNLMKIHDIPILGLFTGAAQNLVTGITWSLMGVAFGAAFGSLTDEQLQEKFNEIDESKDGKLDAQEIAKALRGLNMSEKDVAQMTEKVGTNELDFEQFKKLVKGE